MPPELLSDCYVSRRPLYRNRRGDPICPLIYVAPHDVVFVTGVIPVGSGMLWWRGCVHPGDYLNIITRLGHEEPGADD